VQRVKGRGVTVAPPGPDDRPADRIGASHVVDSTAGSVAKQVRASQHGPVDALINPFGYTAVDLPLYAVRAGGTVWPPSHADGPAARSSSPWG
jgi:hypothetical protein